MSRPERGWPQLAHSSVPSILSAWQGGQIMGLRNMEQRNWEHCSLFLVPGSLFLLHLPGVALTEEGGEVAFALGSDRLGDLLLHEVVVGGARDGGAAADGDRVPGGVHGA